MKSDKTTPNVPTLRFAEFSDLWEQKQFDEVLFILANNTLSRAELNYDNGDYKDIHYGDVLIKYPAYIDVSSSDVPYINAENSSAKLNDALLQNGDVVIADTAEDFTVGKATEIENANAIKVVAGLHTIPCRPKIRFSPKYLGYYINSPAYHDQLVPFIQGVKVSSISKTHIRKTFLSFSSLLEQEKIANFLSCLDEKIQVQNKIIEDLKVLKKELNYSLIGRIINGKSSNCKIEDVIDYEQPTNYIVKSDKYIENGKTPVLTANKAFLLGYTIENEGVYNKSDCIILDDFTLDFKYVNFPFKIKSSAIKILTAKKDIELRYFYEYLLFLGLTSHEHKRHYISEIAPLPLYLPSIDEQRNALSALNSISKKIKVEENYIIALKAQKCFFLRAMFI